MNSQFFVRPNTVRNLGVYYDRKLSYSMQIDGIISKASQMLAFIIIITADFNNLATIKVLNNTYVRG